MSGHNNIPLPEPNAEEITLSQTLSKTIQQEISDKGGRISFARFMELTLYAPHQGYYVNGKQILGEGGDFTTGPELTPLFSHCIARQVIEIADQLGEEYQILEFGGGSGALASETLAYLDEQDRLPQMYYILDVSPYLQALQRDAISRKVPHLLDKVAWIGSMPSQFQGVVLANEVLDAMPVNRVVFHHNGDHKEIYIGWDGENFFGEEGPVSEPSLQQIVDLIYGEQGQQMSDGYTAEINLYARGWLNALYESIDQGAVLLIDYGYPRPNWFIPERFQGTLMCHYRHRAHTNPFILLGLQDITAHVDFTLIAEHAHAIGFNIDGFTNQTSFLTGCGIEQSLQHIDNSDIKEFLRQTNPVKKLMLPHEMGEIFKVIALSKGRSFELRGFALNDQTFRL